MSEIEYGLDAIKAMDDDELMRQADVYDGAARSANQPLRPDPVRWSNDVMLKGEMIHRGIAREWLDRRYPSEN